MSKHTVVFVVHFIIVVFSIINMALPVSAESVLSELPEGSGGKIVDSLILAPSDNETHLFFRASAMGALYAPLIAGFAIDEGARSRVISQYATSVSLATIALSDGRSYGYLTMSAVTGASFATYVFRTHASDSSYRLPVTVAAYSLAALTLASDASGDRSVEGLALDVLAGIVAGYAFPAIHEELGLEAVTFVFLPGTLVVTVNL